MPVKIARSAPRPSFGLPELLVAIQPGVSLAARPESANIYASSGVIRGIPVNSSIGALRIISVNADSVNARGSYVDENGTQVFLSLWINRITGRTSVLGTHGDWIEPD